VGGRAADDAAEAANGGDQASSTPAVHRSYSVELEHGDLFQARFSVDGSAEMVIDESGIGATDLWIFELDDYREFRDTYRETGRVDGDKKLAS